MVVVVAMGVRDAEGLRFRELEVEGVMSGGIGRIHIRSLNLLCYTPSASISIKWDQYLPACRRFDGRLECRNAERDPE